MRLSRFTRPAATVAAGLLVVALLTAPLHAGDEGALTELAILETVEAQLASDGTPEAAQLHTRLDARGHGRVELVDTTAVADLRERGRLRSPTVEDGRVRWDLDLTDGATSRRAVAAYPTGALPVSARIRYELDGEQVSPEELRGATGTAGVRIQLRNATSEPRGIIVGSGDDRQLESVEVALPLLTETHLQFDDSWGELTADVGRVGADAGGATVAWSAALFEPFGSTISVLEVRGEVRGAGLPRVEVDATPVTTDSSDLLATADDLLTDRATVDAVAAFVAASLAEAFGGVVDGATQLAGGLGELEAGVGGATAEFDDVDPEALAADAFAGLAEGLAPPDLADLFDPDALDPGALLADLGDDLDPADLLAELDLDALLADFDPAALLADADLGALIELLLADALPALPEFDLDDDVLESVLADVFDQLGEQISFEELLSAIDLAALLDDLDLDAALADALDDVDLGAALAGLFDELDIDALLAEVDLDAVLAELLGAVDFGDVAGRIDELVGDTTIGDLLGDVDVAELVALLAADVDLELELAAALAALLEELDIMLRAVGQAELEAVGAALEATLTSVETLSGAAREALEHLEEAPGAVEDLPFAELADLATGLAQRLDEVGGVLDGLSERLLDPVVSALDDADGRVQEAREALDVLEGELGDEFTASIAPVRSAIDGVAAAVDTARTRTDEARSSLDALSGELGDLAGGTAALADELRDPALQERITGGLTGAAEIVTEVTLGLENAEGTLASLAAKVTDLSEDLEHDVPLADLLVGALADRTIDLEPVVVRGGEKLVDLLADVRVDEVLDTLGLAELLDELDLNAAIADLLAGLELPDLATLLDEAGLDLVTLLDELDVDLAALLEDVDLTALLDAFDLADLDLAALLDDLEIDPAALLAGVDLAALFDDIDLAALLGPTLDDLDFGEIAERLAEVDIDLAELLDAAGLDPATLLADVDLPDFADVLAGLDFDALLADLNLDPAALLADVDLPGLEGLLDELDLDFDALLAAAGLEDLGDLDEVIAGLLDALAGLAAGGDELADGLAQLVDEGLGRLVAQLDDDARSMQRELATLGALERRADDAHATVPPEGADVSARYRLVLDPVQPAGPGAATLAVLLAAALAAEGLRRRFAG